jgi:hypothetical protein
MNLPVCKSVRVPPSDHTSEKSVPPSDHTSSSKDWGRVPWVIISDGRLTHYAVRVYCVMAKSERGGRCSIGLRWISDCAHVNVKRVRKGVDQLIKFGYVQATKGRLGQRSEYFLTSPLFIPKHVSSAKVDQASTSSLQGEPKSKTSDSKWVFCPLCQQHRPMLLKVGWCRSCNWEKRVARVSEPTARRVSREEIAAAKIA